MAAVNEVINGTKPQSYSANNSSSKETQFIGSIGSLSFLSF